MDHVLFRDPNRLPVNHLFPLIWLGGRALSGSVTVSEEPVCPQQAEKALVTVEGRTQHFVHVRSRAESPFTTPNSMLRGSI